MFYETLMHSVTKETLNMHKDILLITRTAVKYFATKVTRYACPLILLHLQSTDNIFFVSTC